MSSKQDKKGFLPEIRPLLIDLKKLVSQAEDSLSQIKTLQESSSKINTLQLEKQCAEQPELVSDIGNLFADIHYIEKEAGLLQETIDGTLRFLIRSNPERFGLGKVTEKAIDEVYVQSAEYFKSQTFSNLISRVVEKVKNAMLTLEHRRSSLRIEERLYNGEYFQVDQPVYLSRAIKEKTMDNKREQVVAAKKAIQRNKKNEDREDDKEESGVFGTE